jgi:hypothetical protein
VLSQVRRKGKGAKDGASKTPVPAASGSHHTPRRVAVLLFLGAALECGSLLPLSLGSVNIESANNSSAASWLGERRQQAAAL